MPQIDEQDLAQMVRDATESIGAPRFRVIAPHKLHAHQKVSHARAASMPEEVRRKPIVVSSDGFVVDGNHRAWATRAAGDMAVAIELPCDFATACKWLFTLQYVYHLDAATPLRN